VQRYRPAYPRLNMQHPLANGLVFAGLGGGASTNTYLDSSPYGRHGTLTNGPTWVFDSVINRWTVNCAGDDDWIQQTGGPTFTGSVGMWVYPKSTTAQAYLIDSRGFESSGGGYVIRRTDGSFELSAGTVYVDGVASANCLHSGWHYVVVTGITLTLSVWRSIAARSDPHQDYMTAQFADVAFWNRTISQAEIRQLADPSNVMLSGLVLPPRRRFWAVSGGAAPAGNRRRRVIIGAS
jgi:hypothetical protein